MIGRSLFGPDDERQQYRPTSNPRGFGARVGGLIRGIGRGMVEHPIETAIDFSPLGDLKAVAYDAPRAAMAGDRLGLGLALASAIPGIPGIGRLFHGTPDLNQLSDGFRARKRSHRRFDNGNMDYVEIRQPTYFSMSRKVAQSYANPWRAFDYQAADPGVIEAAVDSGANLLRLNARGNKFSQMDVPTLLDQLPEEVRERFASLLQRHGDPTTPGRIRTGDLEAIVDQLGYDGFVLDNVIDNYDGKGRPTTVVAVFDPSLISRRSP